MRKICLVLIALMMAGTAWGQQWNRVIENGMEGPDVTALQRRLLALGFSEIGRLDGSYGPLCTAAITNIQQFAGFDFYKYDEWEDSDHRLDLAHPRGAVDRAFWNFLFDTKNEELLRKISIVTKYDKEKLRSVTKNDGGNKRYELYFSRSGELVIISYFSTGLENFYQTDIYFAGREKVDNEYYSVIKSFYFVTVAHSGETARGSSTHYASGDYGIIEIKEGKPVEEKEYSFNYFHPDDFIFEILRDALPKR